ncbi:MAG: oligoribonuclease [Acidimicrobiia bacterium]|nr:oligoribonuclease [Acidimicrobiia bacterium]
MLVWMDLEMTGLDPAKHVIVEFATLITDDDLNIVAEGPDIVVHATDDELSRMDPVVVEMHTKSGLLEEIKSSEVSLRDAIDDTLAFLREHVPEPRTVPLCGNSIGMDRRFLSIHANEIEEYLHYRSVDVSTIKELARRWNPKALAGVPRKESSHRAMDDIRESIKELQHYRNTVFSDPPIPVSAATKATPGE